MHEPRDASLGSALGWLAVGIGVLFLGMGLYHVSLGQGSEAVEGFVFGGLAFVAGCVILYYRRKRMPGNQAEPGHGEEGAAAERPGE